jgi:hypothetical protein
VGRANKNRQRDFSNHVTFISTNIKRHRESHPMHLSRTSKKSNAPHLFHDLHWQTTSTIHHANSFSLLPSPLSQKKNPYKTTNAPLHTIIASPARRSSPSSCCRRRRLTYCRSSPSSHRRLTCRRSSTSRRPRLTCRCTNPSRPRCRHGVPAATAVLLALANAL